MAEITGALDGRWAYEIVYVNDGSTDATAERLAALMKQHRQLSAAATCQIVRAIGGGAQRSARPRAAPSWPRSTATGQNDPAFLPDLICGGR